MINFKANRNGTFEVSKVLKANWTANWSETGKDFLRRQTDKHVTAIQREIFPTEARSSTVQHRGDCRTNWRSSRPVIVINWKKCTARVFLESAQPRWNDSERSEPPPGRSVICEACFFFVRAVSNRPTSGRLRSDARLRNKSLRT